MSAAPVVRAHAPAVEARGVEKWYGPLPAVRGIDLALARGEFLTIFGPNGAGKSTLLRMLCGAVRPTRGTVRIAGEEVGGKRRGGGAGSASSPIRPFSTRA